MHRGARRRTVGRRRGSGAEQWGNAGAQAQASGAASAAGVQLVWLRPLARGRRLEGEAAARREAATGGVSGGEATLEEVYAALEGATLMGRSRMT